MELLAFANTLPDLMPIGESRLMEYGVRRSRDKDCMEIVLRARFMLVQDLYPNDDLVKAKGILACMPDKFLDELLQQVHREIEARGRSPRAPDWVREQLERARHSRPNTGN